MKYFIPSSFMESLWGLYIYGFPFEGLLAGLPWTYGSYFASFVLALNAYEIAS